MTYLFGLKMHFQIGAAVFAGRITTALAAALFLAGRKEQNLRCLYRMGHKVVRRPEHLSRRSLTGYGLQSAGGAIVASRGV